MRRGRSAGLMGWLVLVCTALGAALHPDSGYAAAPRSAGVAAVEQRTLALLNAQRIAGGIAPLRVSPRLARVARAHSRDMALHHYTAVTAPGGQTLNQRLKAAGIPYRVAGETIGWAVGYAPLQAIAVLNAQMMATPPHGLNLRGLLLNRDLHHVGIGVFLASGNRLYLTEDLTN